MAIRNVYDSCKEIYIFEYLDDIKYPPDFKFIMINDDGDVIEIPAHKSIVSSISDVMHKMIYGVKRNDFTKTHLKVENTSVRAFIEVIRYIYTDKVNITTKNAIDMLTVSNDYAIDKLEKLCIEFLLKQINTKNACTNYSFYSKKHNCGKLVEKCKKTIQKFTKSAFSSEGFYKMDVNTIKELLKLDVLNISELDLFKALLSWAEIECKNEHLNINATNKRQVLDGAGQLLRFRTLTLKEFEDCIRLESRFFNETQIENIRSCIKNKISSTETKRKFYVCQDVTWKQRKINENNPPGAVFAYAETHGPNLFLGRARYKGNVVPVLVKPLECSAIAINVDDYSEVYFKSYEVLCGDGYRFEKLQDNELPDNVVVIDNEATDVPMFIYREIDSGILGIESLLNFCPNDSHTNYEVLVGHNVKSPLPKGVIPDDAVVGGLVDGVEQLICKVYHKGHIVPARVGRGSDFAVFSSCGGVLQKEDFAYLRMDNVKWVPVKNGNIPDNAVIGGKNTFGSNIYIGRVEHENNLVPGKIQPRDKCIYIVFGETELKKQSYEVLVEEFAAPNL